MTHHQEILGAVLYCPQSIPLLYKSYNKKLLTKILYGLLPRRIGLEFECCDHIIFAKDHSNFITSNTKITRKSVKTYLTEHYKVYEFDVQSSGITDLASIFNGSIEKCRTYLKGELVEHTISIIGYKQLIGLYNALEDMKESCMFTKSGIHIHIDATELLTGDNYPIRGVCRLFEPYLNKLESIFGPYESDFNTKDVDIRTSLTDGHSWIAISKRNGNNSIEFRIAPLTFDYTTIVKWCIACTKIVNEVKLKLNNTNPIKNWKLKQSKVVDGS